MKILLEIQFVGTAYAGYQVQDNAPTVQKCLCEAAAKLFGFHCDITGCSRTDSGVHANMFCATVTAHSENYIVTTIPIDRIPRAMNAFLPPDIAVKSARRVDEAFHPRYDVKYKEYIYKIWNCSEKNPFLVNRCWHIPKPINDNGFIRMRLAALSFVGTHDFSSFMASGSKVKSTVRTVKYSDVAREGNLITFTVAADGFLYNMVRIMTGTLIGVASGHINPEKIVDIIAARDRSEAGETAPACGLYLNKVVY